MGLDPARSSAERLRITRNAAVTECVRAAAAFLHSHAEVVYFEEGRAFIAASLNARDVMQPRESYSAERRLLAENPPDYASMDGWLALPIRTADGTVVAALTVSLGVATRDFASTLDGLEALARLIESELVDEDSLPTDLSLIHI